MASFCKRCGAPVSGIFCVKCGHDTRLAGSPLLQPETPEAPPAVPASMPPPAVPVSVPAGAPPAKFCNKCGAPSIGAPFCNKCGADLRQAAALSSQPAIPAAQVPPSVLSPPPPQPPVPSQTMSAPPSQGKGSALTKILVGFAVVVIAVGAVAAGGVYYVVYRVKQKVHEVAHDVPGLGSSPDNSSSGGIMGSMSKMVSGSGSGDGGDSGSGGDNGGISGDPCRLLSRDEVGSAIGVQIVATQSTDGGCSYLAQGDSGDMTAKHMAAMLGAKGVDAKTRNMIQGFAGGMAKAFQSDSHEATSDSNGNVPVFTFGVDNRAAEAQMRLNRKTLARMGTSQQHDIPGIGDQAFDEAGAMMMVRKGDRLIRIMYSTCPCSVEAIKPLAKTLADRL
jgi:hypothetical protein